MTEETLSRWLDQEWLNVVGWTGSCSQTILCAPSHHRTQRVCVVVYWQLPDIYRDMAIASASNTVCTYDSWDTRADTYLHYIVYFILCIFSPGRLIKKVWRDSCQYGVSFQCCGVRIADCFRQDMAIASICHITVSVCQF